MTPETDQRDSAVRRSERQQAVLRLTKQGFSAREIASELECSSRTVVRIRSKLGIAAPSPEPVDPEVLAAAAALIEDQCPFSEIARTLPISTSTLAKRFPGKGWSRAQTLEHRALLAQLNRRDHR